MDVVVVRLKSHGERFELACHRGAFQTYVQKGRNVPPQLSDVRTILVDPIIFSHAYKRQKATNAALRAAFGAAAGKGDLYETATLTILQFGDPVEDEKARVSKRKEGQQLQETVQGMVQARLISKFTGVPLERLELDTLLQKYHQHPAAKVLQRPPVGVDPLHIASFILTELCRLDSTLRRMGSICTFGIPSDAAESSLRQFVQDHWWACVPLSDVQSVVSPAPPPSASPSEGDATPSGQATTLHREWRLITDPDLFLVPQWAAVEKVGVLRTLSTASMDDLVRFSTYEIGLPEEVPSVDDQDVDNRLAALEKRSETAPEQKGGQPPDSNRSSTKKKGSSEPSPLTAKLDELQAKYNAMTLKQLQDRARAEGLSSGGKKEAVIDRLMAHEEARIS